MVLSHSLLVLYGGEELTVAFKVIEESRLPVASEAIIIRCIVVLSLEILKS